MKKNPDDNPENLNMLGCTYFGAGKTDLAEQTFRQALDVAPDDAEAIVNLLYIHIFKQGDTASIGSKPFMEGLPGAIEAGNTGEPEHTGSPARSELSTQDRLLAASHRAVEGGGLNRQGENLYAKGDVGGALDAFIKAIEINPAFATAYNNLGVLYWQAGEVEKAVDHFVRAVEIDPNDRDTVLNCANVFQSLGKVEDAKKIYSSYLERNPDDSVVANALEGVEDSNSTNLDQKT